MLQDIYINIIPPLLTMIIGLIIGLLLKKISNNKPNNKIKRVLTYSSKFILFLLILFIYYSMQSYIFYATNNLRDNKLFIYTIFYAITLLFYTYYFWNILKNIFVIKYSFLPRKNNFKPFFIYLFYIALLLALITLINILIGNPHYVDSRFKKLNISINLITPAFEEVFFRYGLYFLVYEILTLSKKITSNKARGLSIFFISFAFASIHSRFSPMLIILSLILFLSLEESKSILVPIILHYFYNILLVVIDFITLNV